MYKKILFLTLLLAGYVGSAQRIGDDHECFDIHLRDLPFEHERDANCELEPNEYVVCLNETVNIQPRLGVEYLKKTDRYTVTSNDFDEAVFPYGPTAPGTDIWGQGGPNVTWDDASSCVIDLPFKFCFFDKTYDQFVVWSNGILVFYDGTLQCPNGSTRQSWPPDGGINDPTMPAYYRGGVFGTYQHTHWNLNDTPEGRISYHVYGDAPCRKMVVTFYNMPPAGLFPDDCPPPQPLQHHQIVLHETTNVIDVNIIQHNACPADRPYDASALLGILSHTGADSYEAPNRSFGPWDAQRESWRFGPDGDELYKIEYYVDDVLTYTVPGTEFDKSFDVMIDRKKEIRARLVVETCEEEWDEAWDVSFRPAIEIDKLDLEPIVCDKEQEFYDLNRLAQMIREGQSSDEGTSLCEEFNALNFLYFRSEEDALNRINEVSGGEIRDYPIIEGENKVYVRVEPRGIEIQKCFEILETNIIKAPVEVIDKVSVFICDEYTLPVLDNNEYYYKVERLDEFAEYVVKTIPDVYENLTINEPGYYYVYVKTDNKYGCENVKSYLLYVESCTYPKGISPNFDGDNDYLDLTYNNVQELKIYNRHGKLVYEAGDTYKREWAGQDMNDRLLPAGTYFLYVRTKNYEYQNWIQLIYEAEN